MTSSDERASGSARNAAIKLVEDALRSGRIVQADHDMRLDQLRAAQTMQDVDLQVRDLRAAAPAAAAPAPATVGVGAGSQPWPVVNYGPTSTTEPLDAAQLAGAVKKGGRAVGGIIAIIVLASVVVPIAGAIIAFMSARDSFPDFGDLGPTDETTYLPGQAPGENGVNMFTVEAYEGLVEALREEKGSTFVFNAGLYPRYAVLDVPTGVNERYEAYYYDGETLEKNTSRGSSSDEQIDIGDVEPQQLIDQVSLACSRVDDPETWSVYLSSNDVVGTTVNAYCSNSFGESSSIITSLSGEVIYDSEAP